MATEPQLTKEELNALIMAGFFMARFLELGSEGTTLKVANLQDLQSGVQKIATLMGYSDEQLAFFRQTLDDQFVKIAEAMG